VTQWRNAAYCKTGNFSGKVGISFCNFFIYKSLNSFFNLHGFCRLQALEQVFVFLSHEKAVIL
jgi:hypothetical protein